MQRSEYFDIIFKKDKYIVIIDKKVFLALPVVKSRYIFLSNRAYTYLVLLKILRNFGLIKGF